MEFQSQVPLAPLTTLNLGGPAEFFVSVRSEAELKSAIEIAGARNLPVHILGGGSNLIVPDAGVRGLVIDVQILGVAQTGDVFMVGAGEPWDEFVARTVELGFAGLECLSGIPGRVGATPIQNVGAYGQDVSETITKVRCLDVHTMCFVERSAIECAFSYRDSDFKRAPGRFVVTSVTFELEPGGGPALRYAELQKHAEHAASLSQVRELVIQLRRRKSMVCDASDPNSQSAGSFFTNPILPVSRFHELSKRWVSQGLVDSVDSVPRWPALQDFGQGPQDAIKLAAAWLIEKSGFTRGTRRGAVGQSEAHALALVHFGGGSTAELLAYADAVKSAVFECFQIVLEREPRLFGITPLTCE